MRALYFHLSGLASLEMYLAHVLRTGSSGFEYISKLVTQEASRTLILSRTQKRGHFLSLQTPVGKTSLAALVNDAYY